MRVLGLLAVGLCLITAGCIGTVGATAKDTREPANQHAAQELGGSAELVEINAFEATGDDDSTNPYSEDDVDLTDEDIGDGSPPAWVYEYQTDNRSTTIVVAENGTVLANETEDEPEDEDAVPIRDWDVDSMEAAEAAADASEDWEVSGDGFAFYNLERDNESSSPVWSLGRIHADNQVVVARVDADSGEVLEVQTLDGDFGGDFDIGPIFGDGNGTETEQPPEREGGTFTGSLSAAEPTAEHDFEIVQADHPELVVGLSLDTPTTGNTVNATIEGPDGVVGSLEAGDGTVEVIDSWSNPKPGDYTISVELMQGTTQDYTISWCAEGEESGDEDVEQACENVSGPDQAQRLVPSLE
jgi:hypothetical protein